MGGKSEDLSDVIGNQDLESAFASGFSDTTDTIHALAVQHSVQRKRVAANQIPARSRTDSRTFLRFENFARKRASSAGMLA